MSQESSLAVQLHREKRRSEKLHGDVADLKSSSAAAYDKRTRELEAAEREKKGTSSELSRLAAKVLDLELSLNSERQASQQGRDEHRRHTQAAERQAEAARGEAERTVVKAEESLGRCNDDWKGRVEEERRLWREKAKEREEMSERNLASLQVSLPVFLLLLFFFFFLFATMVSLQFQY